MTLAESLRKNAAWLVSGAVSFAAAVMAYRYFAGQPAFQPQADLGALIGVVLIAAMTIYGDLNASSTPKGGAR